MYKQYIRADQLPRWQSRGRLVNLHDMSLYVLRYIHTAQLIDGRAFSVKESATSDTISLTATLFTALQGTQSSLNQTLV